MRSAFRMKLVAGLFVPAVAVLASAPALAAGDKATSPTATTPSTSTTAGKASDATFDRLDANKDGMLTTAEAAKDSSVNSKWKQLDSDNDGKVSRSEFMAQDMAGAKGGMTSSPKK